jgi:hypothetical protein
MATPSPAPTNPAGVRFDSSDCIDIFATGPADTTVRPARPNYPRMPDWLRLRQPPPAPEPPASPPPSEPAGE